MVRPIASRSQMKNSRAVYSSLVSDLTKHVNKPSQRCVAAVFWQVTAVPSVSSVSPMTQLSQCLCNHCLRVVSV